MPKFALTITTTAFVLGAAILSLHAQTQSVKPAQMPDLATHVMMVASKACTACDSALDRCNKNPPYGNDRVCASDYYTCIRKNHCKS
jgi:hypothetical protein